MTTRKTELWPPQPHLLAELMSEPLSASALAHLSLELADKLVKLKALRKAYPDLPVNVVFHLAELEATLQHQFDQVQPSLHRTD